MSSDVFGRRIGGEVGDQERAGLSVQSTALIDWMLPGMSGLEICRRLRASERTRLLPVIMV